MFDESSWNIENSQWDVCKSCHKSHWYKHIYAFPCGPFFPIRDLWICGMTPPPAMVALIRESNSSSPLMASCKWRGVILFTFKSLLALPANSKTSAVRYSKMAALYTAAVAPTRPWLVVLCLRCLWIRPTGNCNPENIKYTILVIQLFSWY